MNIIDKQGIICAPRRALACDRSCARVSVFCSRPFSLSSRSHLGPACELRLPVALCGKRDLRKISLKWLRNDWKERPRGRSERRCGSVDQVKLKWSYLRLNIGFASHHNVHHFHNQNHFNNSLSHTAALLHSVSSSDHVTFMKSILVFLYHLFYLYFILECTHRPTLCSCHGKTECTKWWFIPAFPGPLQVVACLCFCFFFFFSSPFFLIPIFPAWHKGMCVASLSLLSPTFICVSVMAISHCHNAKLLTVDWECLFNHNGFTLPPDPCLSSFARLHVCPLARRPLA